MKSNKDIIAQWKKHKDLSKSKLSKQYSNTKKCQAFYEGDIMSYSDTVQFTTIGNRKKKAMVKFNKVKPYVNAVQGFTLQNRRVTKYEARIENDKIQELFSGYANAIDGYVRDNANADQVESQQDKDMFINGYGAVETALSYTQGRAANDEEGEVIIGRIDPLTLGWDAFARATNLLDARWIYYSKEFALDQALELFDDSDEEDFENADDAEGAHYEYMPDGGRYDKISEACEFTDKKGNMVKVYFYQWYDIEKFYKVANPIYAIDDAQTVQFADMHMSMLAEEADTPFDPRAELLVVDKKTLAALEDYFGDYLGETFEYKRKVYYSAVVSGDKVFTKFKNLSQQGFSITVKTGDYHATSNIWVGLVNSMMEPALYYNKALTELMFTIAANSKGGVYIEEDAVEDIEEFEDNYAKTDGVCVVSPGALSNGKIQDKARANIPTGLEGLLNITDKAMSDVNGIDPTFLGSREHANDTDSFYARRVKQITTTLASYFDSITLAQKTSSRVRLDIIKVFVENNENMTIRVIGAEGQAMFLKLSSKQLSAEFDVATAEAPLTQEDKEKQAKLLITMGDKLIMVAPQKAMVLYAKAVELLPIEFGIREAIRETLNPEQEPVDPAYVKQLEEQLAMMTDERTQAQIASIMAKTQLDTKKIEEADAKIKKDTADTVKTLEESRQTALENDLINSQPGDPEFSLRVTV